MRTSLRRSNLVAMTVFLAALVLAPSLLASSQPPIALTGLVQAAGRPLADAEVELLAIEPNYEANLEAWEATRSARTTQGNLVGRALSDRWGRFLLSVPAPGLYRVRIRAQGFVPVRYQPLALSASAELPPVSLGIDAGATIEFHRRDGQPVAGAYVHVKSSRSGGAAALDSASAKSGWRLAPRTGSTDAKGRLQIARGRGEWLDLALYAPWSDRPHRVIGVEGLRYLLDPTPQPRRTLELREEGGTALAGALLLLGREGKPIGITDAEGRCEVVGRFDEPVRIQALTADGRQIAIWYATPPYETTVKTVAPAKTVRGRALTAVNRKPLAAALVWSSQDPGRFTFSGPDGSWELPFSPPGSGAWVQGQASGYLPRQLKLSPKTQGTDGKLDLMLEPARALLGRVVDEAGNPVPATQLRADADAHPPSFHLDPAEARALSTQDGRFALSGLWPSATYRLTVQRLGFETQTVELAGTTEGPLRLVLVGERAAFGRVLDDDEKPVSGARIRVLASGQEMTPSERRQLTEFAFETFSSALDDPFLALSDATGRFALAALPAGVIDLVVEHDDFAAMAVHGLETPNQRGPVDLGTLLLQRGVTLAGRVVDEAGVALQRVWVWKVETVEASLRSQLAELTGEHTESPAATTDAEGSFQLVHLQAAKPVHLLIAHPGYLPQAIEALQPPFDAPLEIVLESAAVLAGRVMTLEGEQLAAASLTLMPELMSEGALEATALDPDDEQSARTDDTGRFAFEQVRAGRYTLRAVAPGFQPSQPLPIEVPTEVAGAQRRDDLELVLEPGATLAGQALTESSAPLSGARVTAGDSFSFSDAEGRFALTGLPPGPVVVEGRHPHRPKVSQEVVIELDGNTVELIFADGFAVSGRTLDTSGLAIGGAEVVIEGGLSWHRYSALSDSDGHFELAEVAEGRYRLMGRKRGYAPLDEEGAVVVGGGAVRGVEVRLGVGGTIAGNLLGLDYNDLEGVRVVARAAKATVAGRVDYAGHYEIDDLGAGDWLVSARVAGTAQMAEARVPLPAGGSATQDLDFQQGVTLRGFVLLNRRALPRTLISVRGRDVAVERQLHADREGRFELRNLPRGSYWLDASHSRELFNQNLVIELHEDREIVIEVETAALHGRVHSAAGGEALANVLIRLQRRMEGGEAGSVTTVATDEQGQFRFGNLPHGRYHLQARRDGFAKGERPLDLFADTGPLDLALDPTQGLRLRVQLEDGRAPTYVQVAAYSPAGALVLAQDRPVGSGGEVSLPTLPAGQWRLLVATPDAVPLAVEVTAPAEEPVAVRLLYAARLEVRVDLLVRANAVGQLRLFAEDGTGFTGFDTASGQPRSIWPLVAGSASVAGLPPGRWRLEVTAADGASWSSWAVALPRQVARIEIR